MKKPMRVGCLMTFGLLLSACIPAVAQVLSGGSSWALALYTQQDEYAVRRQSGSVTLCYTCDYEGDSIVGDMNSRTADVPVLKFGSLDGEDNSLTATNSDQVQLYDRPVPEVSAAISARHPSRIQGSRAQAYIPDAVPANPLIFATGQPEGNADIEAEINSPGAKELMRVSNR